MQTDRRSAINTPAALTIQPVLEAFTAESNTTQDGAISHPRIDALKRELYAALNAMKPEDMTVAEFEIAVLLADEFAE